MLQVFQGSALEQIKKEEKKVQVKRILALVLLLGLALTLIACGASQESTAATANPSATTAAANETAVSTTSASAEPKTVKVAWIDYSLNDDWFAAELEIAKMEAATIEAEDNVKFDFELYDGAGDEAKQAADVDTVIAKGDADICVIIPINEAAMAKSITKINEEMGIPVGCAGITAAGGDYLYVGLDNVAATEQCGNKMVELLSAKYGDDPASWAAAGGVIIECYGPAGLTISTDRSKGFHNVLDPICESTEGLEIVQVVTNWDPETALNGMNDAIQRYGDKIIGVFSSDDTSASQGAWRAFEQNDMAYPVGDAKHIPIVTYDGTMSGLENVREGHIDMITEQPAFAYGHLLMRYLYLWYRDGESALPEIGTTLSQEDLSQYFGSDTGVAYWGPVSVKQGVAGKYPWLAPQSPVIPDQVDPYDTLLWGNLMYKDQYGSYPTK
jgi:ABC-type sugar transport system substrate-binding protein